jgi:hypothetical protein
VEGMNVLTFEDIQGNLLTLLSKVTYNHSFTHLKYFLSCHRTSVSVSIFSSSSFHRKEETDDGLVVIPTLTLTLETGMVVPLTEPVVVFSS